MKRSDPPLIKTARSRALLIWIFFFPPLQNIPDRAAASPLAAFDGCLRRDAGRKRSNKAT